MNSKSRNARIFVYEQLNTDNLYPFNKTVTVTIILAVIAYIPRNLLC